MLFPSRSSPHPNGPHVSPWLGFFPEFRKDALGFLLRCRSYGDVVKLPLGRLSNILLRQPDGAIYLLNHPDDVKHVLVTNQHNYSKGSVPPVERRMFGEGLLHSEGTQHHTHRRLLVPFFHGDHIAACAETITKSAAAVSEAWPASSTVDVGLAMSRLTLSVIWQVLFGRDVGAEADVITRSLVVGHRLIHEQYSSLLARFTPLWVPTKDHREFSRLEVVLDTVVRQMIRTQQPASQESGDVLSFLCAARDEQGRPLSDETIRDQLVTLILAGHETTANALTWTWFLLGRFSAVRTRLEGELNQVVPGRLPTIADLPKLTYTKMVWDEALRLYPPAWALHRRVAAAEDTLPSGTRIPPGDYVFLSPWSMHRDPRWFTDPDRFDPDRFLPGSEQARPQFSYYPFGGGGRRCLGESFAALEGVLVLATLAARVRLEAVDDRDLEPDPVMTLRPKTPLMMTVHPVA